MLREESLPAALGDAALEFVVAMQRLTTLLSSDGARLSHGSRQQFRASGA